MVRPMRARALAARSMMRPYNSSRTIRRRQGSTEQGSTEQGSAERGCGEHGEGAGVTVADTFMPLPLRRAETAGDGVMQNLRMRNDHPDWIGLLDGDKIGRPFRQIVEPIVLPRFHRPQCK